jgi:hypothetical protein
VPLWELTPHTLVSFLFSLASNLPTLLIATWPLLTPVLAFAVFVVCFNEGGIVVGDKDNHRLVLHAAMPLHAVLVVALLMGPKELLVTAQELFLETRTMLWGATSTVKKVKFILLRSLFLAAVTAILYWGCLSHPFLQADNR